MTVDPVAADVAVAETRRIDGLVIGRDGQPAQLGRFASAGVNRHERADLNLAIGIDAALNTTIADRFA